ncbi:clan AA aspartic protease [Candidatus Poribacteria bacterium]|nr:MAG: clan AA aspartic protease [Candidatus Poribacteria bacterium]
MIIGKIRADQEAVIESEIVGLNHNEKVEVVLDTGFTGFLMLPSDLIKRLGLQLIGNRRAILGDGSPVSFDLYLAQVVWHGRIRNVLVLGAKHDGALLGMSMLSGSRTVLEVIQNGTVTIAPLA